MTYISPILQEKINATPKQNTVPLNKTHHQKIYENLTLHANDVKPNEAKAKLVKETPLQSFVSYFKDLKQDCSNFFTAVKTGKMNDNSLGRINDLGLKAGGLLIATYLAANAKSKTDAAMKFIGGGAFFASMSLWPKLFINLPAKIVHGFDIGQKYISAQGDKKDFFLDNQFLPWDAYSKEELAKIGKYNNIDINSENGKEKIERKMQKVALQNRTLWMATAGFATPLMTALFCDAVEPHVEKGIINAQFNKINNYIQRSDLKTDFESIDVQAKNLFESIKAGEAKVELPVDKFFKNRSTNEKGFFEELASMLNPAEIGLSKEESKAIKNFHFDKIGVQEALKALFDRTCTVDISSEDTIKGILKSICGGAEECGDFGIDYDAIYSAIKAESQNNSITLGRLIRILNKNETQTNETIERLRQALPCDSSKFKDTVQEFYVTTLEPTRAKLKLFTKTINSTVGEVSDSKSTLYITSSLKHLIKEINPNNKTLKIMKSEPDSETFNVLHQYFTEALGENKFNSKEYKKLIDKIISFGSKEDKKSVIDDIFSKLTSIIDDIKPNSNPTVKELSDAAEGTINSSLFNNILPKYLREQRTNVNSFISRAAICANFEARLKEGLIKIDDIDLRDDEELLKAARKIIYEGNQAFFANYAFIQRADKEKVFKSLLKTLFSEDAFKDEPEIVKETAKGIANGIEDFEKYINNTENYLRNMNLVQQVKKAATSMANNRAWKRMFLPMAIALVAVTLIAQPFFGKIDKEFPEKENKEKEGKVNDK